ncbi:MAG: urate hydroxylase PuuD [Flavobacteriales bacterium]|nr:urate hydroxylase PuuD [Flavobacteriales bacterium]
MTVAPTFLGKVLASASMPYAAVVCGLLLFLFLWFRHLADMLKAQLGNEALSAAMRFDLEEARSTAIASRQACKFFFLAVLISFLAYVAVVGTPMYGYVMEWLNLAVRWTHVIAGIMWIGASFYFIFLENNLNRTHGLRDELAGNLWAIHGGGFYYVEKYKVAPR